MTDQTPEARHPEPAAEPLALRLNDLLGQVSVAPGPTGYSIEAVKVCVEGAYKAGQAAERERCAKLCDGYAKRGGLTTHEEVTAKRLADILRA